MKKYELNLKQAVTLVHSRRSIISPNDGFLAQLVSFEEKIHGQKSVESEFFRFEDLLLKPPEESEREEEIKPGHFQKDRLIWFKDIVIAIEYQNQIIYMDE